MTDDLNEKIAKIFAKLTADEIEALLQWANLDMSSPCPTCGFYELGEVIKCPDPYHPYNQR